MAVGEYNQPDGISLNNELSHEIRCEGNRANTNKWCNFDL